MHLSLSSKNCLIYLNLPKLTPNVYFLQKLGLFTHQKELPASHTFSLQKLTTITLLSVEENLVQQLK